MDDGCSNLFTDQTPFLSFNQRHQITEGDGNLDGNNNCNYKL